MGLQREYNKGRNDFYSYLYTTQSARITRNGVSGKIIDKKDVFQSKKKNLPVYSKSSQIYFMPGHDGKIVQARLYDENHRMKMDFDWSHTHINKNGEVFLKGSVHIQEYVITREQDSKTRKWRDKFVRVKDARRMTTEEIEKYGPILRYFVKNIRF